jgi:NAD(P)-dependent dehydrogenase (short-subunit alcohol dehydrogenase family)
MKAAKVAIVTGAGSGIGRVSAIALMREGYTLALAGRRRELLQETADIAHSSVPGSEAIVISTDVAEPDSVRELFSQTKASFGRLDLLFNNAGVFGPKVSLEEISYAQWRSVVEINLTGAMLCTQEAFRMMKAQQPMGGRIINNGSVSATTPRPDSAPYTATKHAMTGLTKSTSLDGRKYNIACGQIDVGNAATDLTKDMQTGMPQADGSVIAEATMDAEDVARAVVYMASLPLQANVQFMTVMASAMPFVGRG